jgi:RNA polymerase sigma factor (TIGR02999 family)
LQSIGRFGTLNRPNYRELLQKGKARVSEEPSAAVAAGSANEQLFAQLYAELRQLAERQLRRNSGAPISPTTLLHEAYLGMSDSRAVFPDRQRFMGYAARVMRGLIIDFVRERRALKRGAGVHITQLPTEVGQVDATELSRISDVLDELAAHEPRLAEVVDLRYFCGFTFEDIAAQRGTSARTVQRDWEKARLILFQRLHVT